MSNCISIRASEVIFTLEELDISGLMTLLDSVRAVTDYHDLDTLSHDQQIAWWFLAQNTHLLDGGRVSIKFGRGRSSHTWRDFGATLVLLSKFVRIPKRHTFYISDEFDGFKAQAPWRINFKTPNDPKLPWLTMF